MTLSQYHVKLKEENNSYLEGQLLYDVARPQVCRKQMYVALNFLFHFGGLATNLTIVAQIWSYNLHFFFTSYRSLRKSDGKNFDYSLIVSQYFSKADDE